MPSIEITDSQAAALARGENITLAPEPPEPTGVFIAVETRTGKVFRWTNAERRRTGLVGTWKVLDYGSGFRYGGEETGTISTVCCDEAGGYWKIVEVSR